MLVGRIMVYFVRTICCGFNGSSFSFFGAGVVASFIHDQRRQGVCVVGSDPGRILADSMHSSVDAESQASIGPLMILVQIPGTVEDGSDTARLMLFAPRVAGQKTGHIWNT